MSEITRPGWLAVVVLFLSDNVREIVFVIGFSALSIGIGMWSIPAALIVDGCLLLWLAIPPAATPPK